MMASILELRNDWLEMFPNMRKKTTFNSELYAIQYYQYVCQLTVGGIRSTKYLNQL